MPWMSDDAVDAGGHLGMAFRDGRVVSDLRRHHLPEAGRMAARPQAGDAFADLLAFILDQMDPSGKMQVEQMLDGLEVVVLRIGQRIRGPVTYSSSFWCT